MLHWTDHTRCTYCSHLLLCGWVRPTKELGNKTQKQTRQKEPGLKLSVIVYLIYATRAQSVKLFIMEFLLHIAMTTQRFLDVSLKRLGCTTLKLLSNYNITLKIIKQIRIEDKMKKLIKYTLYKNLSSAR